MGTFGRVIKKLRVSRRWSHDRLARETRLSKAGVINIEKLEGPTVRDITLEALAQGFGMKSEELVNLYEAEAKNLPPKAEITVADDHGNVTKLPDEMVSKMTAAAVAEGKRLADWMSAFLDRVPRGTADPDHGEMVDVEDGEGGGRTKTTDPPATEAGDQESKGSDGKGPSRRRRR